MLYFAYGSNLDPKQMKERCPSYQFRCLALLPRFRLAFTRYSEKRRSWVADVVEDDASPGVWGVVYDISKEELKRLDTYEGYYGKGENNAYERCCTSVLVNGDEDRPLGAFIYVAANKSDKEHTPAEDYLRHIISGATHWELPEDYLEMLKRLRAPQ
ncbi:MAG: gamma-glutamylcyclotransferase [Actinobacteria bacterium]|nr:gamma-glutamylcyclotransferase [Actinomycetota bacterium]